jgi:hypothetical protein
MAKKPIDVGGLSFPTKGKAREHYRKILHDSAVGVPLPEPAATEVRWLFERHPEAESKADVGISHFSVRSAIFDTRCFEVVRTDGQGTDFSLDTCLDGKAPTAIAEALKAMRAEVSDDIRQKKWEIFRSSALPEGKARCASTGALISLDEAFADHAPPHSFKSIALGFLASRGIDVAAGFVTPSGDNQYQPTLADPAVAADWRAYYNSHAVIRVVARRGSS